MSVAFVCATSLALLACRGGDQNQTVRPDCESGGTPLSGDQIVDLAVEQTGHLIQDGTVTSSTAEMVPYERAARQVLEEPNDDLPPDRCAWLVQLRGSFYEPGGPGSGPGRQGCSLIKVTFPDTGGQYLHLTLEPVAGC
jgi:hypothetical protein